MDLWQLRTFLTVSRVLNFTRAAEELNLSQPAVSHHIKSIERQIGEPVFERSRQGVELTPAGQILVEYAKEIVGVVDDLKQRIDNNRDEIEGIVLIGGVTRSFDVPFVQVQQAFSAVHPDLKMRFRNFMSSEELFQALERSYVDVALFEDKPDEKKFDFIPYGNIKMSLVAGSNHRFAGKSEIDPVLLNYEKWALFEKGDIYRTLVEKVFRHVGIEPKSIHETNDGSVILDLLATGNYVSVLGGFDYPRDLKEGLLVELSAPDFDIYLPTFVAWRKENKMPAVDAFVQFFIKHTLPGVTPSELVSDNES